MNFWAYLLTGEKWYSFKVGNVRYYTQDKIFADTMNGGNWKTKLYRKFSKLIKEMECHLKA